MQEIGERELVAELHCQFEIGFEQPIVSVGADIFSDVSGDAGKQLMEPFLADAIGLRKCSARGLVAACEQRRSQDRFVREIFRRRASGRLRVVTIHALEISGRLGEGGEEVRVRHVKVSGRQASALRLAARLQEMKDLLRDGGGDANRMMQATDHFGHNAPSVSADLELD